MHVCSEVGPTVVNEAYFQISMYSIAAFRLWLGYTTFSITTALVAGDGDTFLRYHFGFHYMSPVLKPQHTVVIERQTSPFASTFTATVKCCVQSDKGPLLTLMANRDHTFFVLL